MFREFLLLTKLEGKRFKRSIRYWLSLIGFDANQSRLYQLYVSAFWSFWIFAIWGFLIDQIYHLSNQISPEDMRQLLQGIPFVIFALQLFFLSQILRNPPLKLDAPNLLYVATAPISRGVITTIHFFRKMFIPTIFISLLGTLTAMFFAWTPHPATVGIIGIQAFIITALLVYLTGASCWIVGLLKQNLQSARHKRIFWLVIPLLLLAHALLPQVVLWPGYLWVTTIESAHIDNRLVLLLFNVIIALLLLQIVGHQIQMTFVIADSQMYAKIQRLGVFGRIMAADVIARIRYQTQLSKKRILKTGLPVGFVGNRALLGQSYLILRRLSPETFFRLLFSGAALVATVVLITMSIGEPSLQVWLILFTLLLQNRPHNITRIFREHLQQQYLRQFMPQNNLLLFVLYTAILFTVTSLGMIAFLIVQPWIEPIIGTALALSNLMIVSLCLALDMVSITRYVLPHIAYEYSLLFSGTIIVGSGYLSQSLWVALGTTIIINIVLMFLLYHSKPR